MDLITSYSLLPVSNRNTTSQFFLFFQLTICSFFIFLAVLPYKAKMIVSRNELLPAPFDLFLDASQPVTKFNPVFNGTSCHLEPNDRKFLKPISLQLIFISFTHYLLEHSHQYRNLNILWIRLRSYILR